MAALAPETTVSRSTLAQVLPWGQLAPPGTAPAPPGTALVPGHRTGPSIWCCSPVMALRSGSGEEAGWRGGNAAGGGQAGRGLAAKCRQGCCP